MKSTKKRLISSVLALIMCVCMLIGTTFAWFTDSVTSGKNRIVAGNLDVEMFYKNANTLKDADADDDWANVATAPETDPKFFVDVNGKDILWEPGVVSICDFEVRNVGNLALKYNFTTKITAETKTPAGNSLTEVIKAAVVPYNTDVSTREKAIAAGEGEWANIDTFANSGAIEADGAPDQFKVILYWAPNANEIDNLYNMNNENNANNAKSGGNGTVLDITIDINLFATQLQSEDDSFDETYDAGAPYLSKKVSTEAELKEALASIGNYKISLENDIALTPDSSNFRSVIVKEGSDIILDLNGHTISFAEPENIMSW